MTITTDQATSPGRLNQHVGAEVRAWMGRRNYRQRDVASVLGVSQAAVSSRLSGRVPFGIDELGLIAAWLGITLADLLGSEALNTKMPRPHKEDGAGELPRLDLNQQPFD